MYSYSLQKIKKFKFKIQKHFPQLKMSENQVIESAIALLFVIVLSLPFVGYTWYLYKTHYACEYFVKRQNIFISGLLCFVTLSFCINLPLLIIAEYSIFGISWNVYFEILQEFDLNLILGIHTIYCLRFFILFYDLSLHKVLSKHVWVSSIGMYALSTIYYILYTIIHAQIKHTNRLTTLHIQWFHNSPHVCSGYSISL